MMQTEKTFRTTCPYCGVGCGVLATRHDDHSVTIQGDPDHPANYGRLCSKGTALGETFGLEERLLFPEIEGQRCDWERALRRVADRFSQTIAAHGPNSVAFYVSGQILTEDYYVANKLMKGYIGSANIDTNSRLCMASSVAGHKRAFGSDTVPGQYEDLEHADLVILTGSHLAWCHPVLFQRLLAARTANPALKIVVIDPRRTTTADIADLHLPLAPDSDVALFNGLLRALAQAGKADHSFIRNHTEGLDDCLAEANHYSLDVTHHLTGLSKEALETFFDWFLKTEKTVTLYSQGVNQSERGTDKVNAILNCHLFTGRIGKLGMGPFSATGQPNAMGGREVGGLANQLAAHMELGNPQHRRLVQSFWQSPRLADAPGLKAVDLFKAVAKGDVKALWIMATNPVDSLPDADAVKAALQACPFVVISDVSAQTDSLPFAHVKLPAAAYGEKSGTVTNSERCISRQRSFLPLPGDAKPDWWIISQVAQRMGWKEAFDYPDEAAIFREHAALSAYENHNTRDFDIGALRNLSRTAYDQLAPVIWPCPEKGARKARFFADGHFYTKTGRAKFITTAPLPSLNAAHDPQHPFIFNTGRVRDHWHTMTRTGQSERLSGHYGEPFLEIHPKDAAALDLKDASLAEISSDYGHALLRVLITERQRPGSVFAPLHWSAQYAAQGRIGSVIAPVTDPFSGQPASKMSPVAVKAFAAAWYGFAISVEKPAQPKTSYWALAKTKGGWRMELAEAQTDKQKTRTDGVSLMEQLFGPDTATEETLSYYDQTAQLYRLARFREHRLTAALFLAPAPVAVSRSWACHSLTVDCFSPQDRLHFLAGRPGSNRPDPGQTLCACFDVGINQVLQAIKDGHVHSVEEIGQKIQAGSNCGSCRPELKRLLDANTTIKHLKSVS